MASSYADMVVSCHNCCPMCRQVLLLDADNLPLANPERLFSSDEYRHTGALFFPDWCEKHHFENGPL